MSMQEGADEQMRWIRNQKIDVVALRKVRDKTREAYNHWVSVPPCPTPDDYAEAYIKALEALVEAYEELGIRGRE